MIRLPKTQTWRGTVYVIEIGLGGEEYDFVLVDHQTSQSRKCLNRQQLGDSVLPV